MYSLHKTKINIMNILKLVSLFEQENELTDKSRLELAKLMIDSFDSPRYLTKLKTYLDAIVEYENN